MDILSSALAVAAMKPSECPYMDSSSFCKQAA